MSALNPITSSEVTNINQTDPDQQTNDEFVAWATEYPVNPSEQPDPLYASCNQYKLQYAGMNEGKIMVKVGCDFITEYEDTIENRRYIIDCHRHYKTAVTEINSKIVKQQPDHGPSVSVRDRAATFSGTAAIVEANKQYRTEIDQQTVQNFDVWKQNHTVKSWDRPDLNPRHAAVVAKKLKFVGMTEDGKIQIKVGNNNFEVFDDTPANKATILERHSRYLTALILMNQALREKGLH